MSVDFAAVSSIRPPDEPGAPGFTAAGFAAVGFNSTESTTASNAPMKFSDLESAYLASAQASTAANQVLTNAQVDAQAKAQAATKAQTTFATAIVAKGGEVSNTATGITYKSGDSQTVSQVKLVTTDDDVPDPTAPSNPPSDPTSLPSQ